MDVKKLALFLVVNLSANLYFFSMFSQYIIAISPSSTYWIGQIHFVKQNNWSKETIITNLTSSMEVQNATICHNPIVRCDNCINPIIKCNNSTN